LMNGQKSFHEDGLEPVVVVHTWNPNIWEADAGRFKVWASLGYIVSSRPAWAMWQDIVSKAKQNKKVVVLLTGNFSMIYLWWKWLATYPD
jgi:hypothetical protein